MRSSDAMPRCARLMTQPTAIIGHTTMPKRRIIEISVPTCNLPAMTSLPPAMSRTMNPSPTMQRIAGKKTDWIMETRSDLSM
jgi:hypothetical protein